MRIEELNLMQQYDKDKEKSRSDWLSGVLKGMKREIPVKYVPTKQWTLACPFWGHLFPHEGTCEDFDIMTDMEIDEARGK